MPNIFISHNSRDKNIVEPIAIRLASIYGQESVFYDSWSIQPGDGIVDKMNEGLLDCDYFFFFVSKNSLQSNMVKLEWQNALYQVTQNRVKLIPVKLDDCMMPMILLQSLYIDIYGCGLEVGFRQIVDVINNVNTFRSQYQTYENVRAVIKKVENGFHIEIKAISYLEPIARFMILIDCDPDCVKINCVSDGVRMTGNRKNVVISDNLTCNVLFEAVSRGLTPGFPYIVDLINTENPNFNCYGVMKAVSQDEYRMIPAL